MFHTFLGEKLPDWQSAATLVRKIAENYKLPYYTISPTYSVCRTHGYLAGEQHTCPHCGSKTEVYSRITGYYRPVQNWNDGKVQEFKDRKVYSILDYREHKQREAEAAAAAEKSASPDVAAAYTLFTTKTCPNCKAAKAILDRAGIKYDVVDAEDEPELALRYGVMQVPALVVVSFGENGSGNAEKLSGVGPINGFVRSMGCEQTAN